MKINYYKETDSLYIDLSSKPSSDSKEISEGIVLDYDSDGNIVGIDIDNASLKIDLKEVTLSKIPAEVETLIASSSSNTVSKMKASSSDRIVDCEIALGRIKIPPIWNIK